MAGDGVSMPTTIAQMGSVAKTQAKAQQQPAQHAAPFAEQMDKQEELRLQRVKETQEAEKKKIEQEEKEQRDRRRRRREKRREKLDAREEDRVAATDSESDSEENETIGTLLDLRV